MKMKKQNYEIASNVTGRKIEKAEITKFELAEEKDHIDVSYILASSVPNGNGALFTKEELVEKAETIMNTPLIIVPSWEDGSPTGHSIEDFPKIGWDAKIVGTHIAAETFEEDGVTHLKTTARVWKIRYPEIAATMVSLHAVGKLMFSMEAAFSDQEVNGTIRTLKGVKFIGSAVVDDPANPYSYSLEVAKRNQKEENGMTLEEALKKIGTLEGELETAQKAQKTAEGTASELTGSLEKANKTIDDLQGKVSEFEKAAKDAAEKEVATKRLTEMAQYVKYSDEEKKDKMATFASMSEEVYALVLETAKKNKPEEKTETAGISSDTSIQTDKGFLDGIEDLD